MYAVTVTFAIKPEHWKAFLPQIRHQAKQSLTLEPECHVFDVWISDTRPYQVFLHELYDNAAAFEEHLRSAHFKAFDAAVASWVESKDIKTWNCRLEPEPTAQG